MTDSIRTDLPNSHARTWRRSRSGDPMAFQLRLLLDNSVHDQEPGLGYVPALGFV